MDFNKLKAYTEAFFGTVKVGAIGYFGNSPTEIEKLIDQKAEPKRLDQVDINLWSNYRTDDTWYKFFYEL